MRKIESLFARFGHTDGADAEVNRTRLNRFQSLVDVCSPDKLWGSQELFGHALGDIDTKPFGHSLRRFLHESGDRTQRDAKRTFGRTEAHWSGRLFVGVARGQCRRFSR